jgi:hypothetical protein
VAKMTGYTTIPGLNKALRSLPKEVSAKMRDAAQGIAGKVAGKAAGAAQSEGGVAALVAPTIKARRDRIPVVRMGSNARLPSDSRNRIGDRQTIGDVIWGAEYGGGSKPTTRQFEPWRGSGTGAGYFLWPTVRGMNTEIDDTYSKALLEALEDIE